MVTAHMFRLFKESVVIQSRSAVTCQPHGAMAEERIGLGRLSQSLEENAVTFFAFLDI